MTIPYLTTPQLILPAAATSDPLIPSGMAWVDSAPIDLADPIGVAGWITGVTLFVSAAQNNQYEVDILLDDIVVGTIKGYGRSIASLTDNGAYWPIYPVIPFGADAKISAIIRLNDTNVSNRFIALTYVTDLGGLEATTQILKVSAPGATMPTVASPGVVWTPTAAVKIIDALDNTDGLAICGPIVGIGSGHVYTFQVELGYGTTPGGPFTWIDIFRGVGGGDNNSSAYFWKNPRQVPADQEIVMRWSDGDNPIFAGATISLGCHYFELPL